MFGKCSINHLPNGNKMAEVLFYFSIKIYQQKKKKGEKSNCHETSLELYFNGNGLKYKRKLLWKSLQNFTIDFVFPNLQSYMCLGLCVIIYLFYFKQNFITFFFVFFLFVYRHLDFYQQKKKKYKMREMLQYLFTLACKN